MGKIIHKNVGSCDMEIKETNGRVTFKCKNRKKSPSAKEILDSNQKKK